MMNWKTIFNPFGRFDERILLCVGILFFIVLIPLCFWTGTYFSSIFRLAHPQNIDVKNIILHNVISFVSAILVLYGLGLLFYRKTRIIDIANTVLLSQIPLIIILPLEKVFYIKKVGERVVAYQNHPTGAFPFFDFIVMIFIILITLGALIYSFILLYNGFRTAANIKKWQQITIFCLVSFLTILICQTFNN
ncbi:hypothetical protein [Epilithonimonas sp.]|uniref:hypothetical protein n=1 Tax=Epilithonimonas sp. TaxID=2894511 RepID=UPI0035AF3586